MMSNSPLVEYTKISPNSRNPRTSVIRKITPHHMAGNLTIESCGEIFASAVRRASSHYAIGTDGRVGMYVEEKNRAWTSNSSANDDQAVTIEVANKEIGGGWRVSDKAFAKLLDLCVDICRRNGIEKLVYTGDSTGNLTTHNMFAATLCPGPYLEGKMPYIAEEVNRRLEDDDMDGKTIYERLNEYTAKLEVPDWAKEEFAETVEADITDGTNPTQLIPRYQAAIMAKRAADKAGNN